MSLVTSYITFRFLLKDRGGNQVPMVLKSNIISTLSANSMLDSLVAQIPQLTQAKVISATYTTGYVEDDLSIDDTNGEVEEKLEISCALVLSGSGPGQTKFATITIPAPRPELFLATSGALYNVLDVENADIQSFLDNYTAGLVLGGLTLSDYQPIEDPTVPGNIKGKRIHKGSRKG